MAVQNSKVEGTRFRLFPQAPFVDENNEPETVVVSCPAGSVGPGPEDDRMYTVFPVDKWPAYGYCEGTYGPYVSLPPWSGDVHPPAVPDAEGHFDSIPVDSDQFLSAHLFGTVRFVLDIWETYFGHEIKWHFDSVFEKLELGILPKFQNAQIGYGFLETGSNTSKDGFFSHFCLNFDVIAHEVGHGIIYSQVGVPTPEGQTGEYYGLQESAADLTALISMLHFDSIVNELLANSSGNLYSFNRFNRFAELTQNEQIRLAANRSVMSDFAEGWRKEHELSKPLTGAMFDIFVDIFHEILLEKKLITKQLENLSDQIQNDDQQQQSLQPMFDKAYQADQAGFAESLRLTRDIMGTYLAEVWSRIQPDNLDYVVVREALLDIDEELNACGYWRLIKRNFDRREIGIVDIGARKAKLDSNNSHINSSRVFVPDGCCHSFNRHLTFYEMIQMAKAQR